MVYFLPIKGRQEEQDDNLRGRRRGNAGCHRGGRHPRCSPLRERRRRR